MAPHTAYPRLSANARNVAERRYLAHTHDGELLESIDEMWHRVATAIADVEQRYDTPRESIIKFRAALYDAMARLDFLPAGRTLANAGAPTKVVPNCVVLSIEDSMSGIFSTLKDAAELQQAGAGIGFPFHKLRPAGTPAKTSIGVASGPVSFLRAFDAAFTVIKQHGRHGANMAIMRVDHPDILEFVHAKIVEGDLQNFNISVGLTREFMDRVGSGSAEPWMCRFGGREMLPRRIERDSRQVLTKVTPVKMTARDLFTEIVTAAHKFGEPGCVFLDTANDTNPLPRLGALECTNPCGKYAASALKS